MKTYKCHKTVTAAKILHVLDTHDDDVEGGQVILLDDKSYVFVTLSFSSKHKLNTGNYFVVYEDGYQSISPAAAFESGYTEVP